MAGNDAQNGAFLAAIRAQNGSSSEDDILPMIFPDSQENPARTMGLRNAPFFCELITAEGRLNYGQIKDLRRWSGNGTPNGGFLVAIRVQNVDSPESDILPTIFPDFERNPGKPVGLEISPFFAI